MRWDRQNIFLLAGPFRYKRRGEFVTVGFVSTYFTVILLGFEMFFFSFFFFFFYNGVFVITGGVPLYDKKENFFLREIPKGKKVQGSPHLARCVVVFVGCITS